MARKAAPGRPTRPTALSRRTTELTMARERIEQLDREADRVRFDLREMEADRDRWRKEHVADPEAEALSACVRAFDAMFGAGANGESRVSGAAWQPMMRGDVVYGTYEEPRATALDNPVGRVLLALAARYGLAIEATKPEPRLVEGQRLVSVPAAIAEQLDRLIANGALG